MREEISRVIDIVDRSGLKYRVNPMATCIEGEWAEVMDVIRRCHEATASNAGRIITSIRIDDRRDQQQTLESQVRSIEEQLRHPIPH